MSKFSKSDSKGFTLIELLIVIIIIGILAAIAFVAYGSSTSKAHKAAAQSTLAQVKEKLGVYYADNNSYPAVGSTTSTSNVDNWLAGSAGGNSNALSTTFVGSGYTYAVTPTGCGDTVATGGAVTAGTTPCTGFTLTGSATNLSFGTSPGDDVTVTN